MTRDFNFPALLIWEDKHGAITYIVNSREDVSRAYYGIIKAWAAGGYVWEPDANVRLSRKMREAMALSQEQVDALSDSIKREIVPLRQTAAVLQGYDAEEAANYAQFKRVADSADFKSFAAEFSEQDDLFKNLRSVIYTYQDGEYMRVGSSYPSPLPE